MQDRVIAPGSGRTACAGIGVFIVKAHRLWAFGFGQRQGITPGAQDQGKRARQDRRRLSPPVTTCPENGDRIS